MEYELGGTESGQEHLEAADSLALLLGGRDLAFEVHQTRALRATRTGHVEDALQQFAAAESLAPWARDLEVCKMFLNRGTLRLERFDLAGAQRDLERCDARAAGRPELIAMATMARHNLGFLEFLRGNLPAALRLMSEAASIGGGAAEPIALLDRARVLNAAGLIDAADESLDRAAEEFRHGRMFGYLAEAELARAECALITGDYGRVRVLAGAARTRFGRRGNEDWRRRSELVLLGGACATAAAGPGGRCRGTAGRTSSPRLAFPRTRRRPD